MPWACSDNNPRPRGGPAIRPLEGRTVLVTRPKHQAEGLTAELERLGAKVAILPAIEIRPLESTEKLDEALRNLSRYDWVVLTSVNGVKSVGERLQSLGIDARVLAERRLAAIGPATAAELALLARPPDLVPAEFVSEAIADALGDVRGKRFLLARADIARKDLAKLLREKGAMVDEVAAYRIVRGSGTVDLPDRIPDYITLTSSSAVRGTCDVLKENGRAEWMSKSHLVSIGPITSATLRELGFQVAAEASEYTVPGLIQAMIEHSKKEPIHA